MKVTKVRAVKQLLLRIPPKKPKYIQRVFRFPKVDKKLDKMA